MCFHCSAHKEFSDLLQPWLDKEGTVWLFSFGSQISVSRDFYLLQSCLTLCHPLDCSPPGSSFHGILQARFSSVSSVAQLCPTLCDPIDCSTLGLPVHHQLPGFTQTHVHWVGDAIQPSHPLSSPSPPAFNLSQHQGLFKWVISSHQVAKVLEFQLQHQSFQWIFRTDFL